MTDPLADSHSEGQPSWRFAERADAEFLYDLAVALDPCVWRFCRKGLVPFQALETVGEYEAIAIFELADGQPCGFAGLVDLSGDGRCAQLDLHAAPFDDAVSAVMACVTEVIAAAFSNPAIQHLYVERFDVEPDLLADLAFFHLEVEIPEFAFVAGTLASRLTYGTSRAGYDVWMQESA